MTAAVTVPAASVAKILRKDSATTSDTEQEVADLVNTSTERQEQAIKTSTKESVMLTAPAKRTPYEKAQDRISSYLEIYKNTTPYDSIERVRALQKILDIVTQHTSKTILDTVLRFFIENKDQAFLDPINALQGIAALDKSSNLKVRLLYTVFRRISTRTATRENTNIESLRTIFGEKNDAFIAWVATKVARK